jgi:GNAT superfamily N-acetyltransferase
VDLDLYRRVIAALDGYLQLGNEVFEAGGATFVRNTAIPNRHDANYVTDVRAETPAEIERLLARIEHEYAHTTHRRIDWTPDQPPAFDARLCVEGWKRNSGIQLLLEGDLLASPKPCDIHLIENEEQWLDHDRLTGLDWQESSARTGGTFNPALLVPFRQIKRNKEPAARHWLAYADGAARAYFSSWPGTNGIGQVEDLFTEKAYRHRGIATALIAHCVADARARGARQIVITADPTDTPMRMYAAMGFRPLITAYSWELDVTPRA